MSDNVSTLITNFTNVGAGGHGAVGGCKVAHRVFANRLYIGVVLGREGLVTGLEVEYLSVSAFEKTARPEHLTA